MISEGGFVCRIQSFAKKKKENGLEGSMFQK